MNPKIKHYSSEIPAELLKSDLPPLLQRVYANRNVKNSHELNYQLNQLMDYRSLKGIDDAVKVIADAVFNKKSIMIIGDYDADGATSTALMCKALTMFGHENVKYLVPNRFEYGYGLTPQIVDVALGYQPDLIITVDNGISSIDGVKRAKENGIQVVITDHHLAGKQLPDADAIVNPNQPGCEFTSKCIAGVGVAFYTMLALRAHLRDKEWFEASNVPNMSCLLDLVALGTVADVVPLDKNNRIMVEHGLQRIRSGRCISGISELLMVANRKQSSCNSMDLAFYVAPRLNAAGRLEDMSQGIECLLSEDQKITHSIAMQLHSLNIKRRDIEKDMLDNAFDLLQTTLDFNDGKTLPAGLCIYDASWHQGVIGLLASRVKEQYYRPVIAFADGGNGEIKGSARSIPGLHIRDVLDAIATSNPGLIEKFGGHAMAAGLSINKAHYEDFSKQFKKEVGRQLKTSDLEKIILSDGSVSKDSMNLETAEVLQFAGPWGQCFQEPVFDDIFEIDNWKIIGENHLKLQVKLSVAEESSDLSKNQLVDAIAFNKNETALPENSDLIRASYRMSVNEFRNKRTLQLIIDCIEPV